MTAESSAPQTASAPVEALERPPSSDLPDADAPERIPFEDEALQHLDALYRTALRMTRSPQDAEDLVQDTLVRGFRYYDRYRPGTNFRAWLFRILTNTFINTHRRRQARPQESSLDDTEEFFLFNHLSNGRADAPDDVESTVLDQLGADAVQRAIDQLPRQYRTAVQLADVEGLSYAEVAEATGVAKGTVMSRLFRGRRMLQRALWEQAEMAGYLGASKSRDALAAEENGTAHAHAKGRAHAASGARGKGGT